MYIVQPMPMGMAMSDAARLTSKVPITRGTIPYMSELGRQMSPVRKFQRSVTSLFPKLMNEGRAFEIRV